LKRSSLNIVLVTTLVLFLLAAFTPASPVEAAVSTASPVVQVVMFWMDDCPHCDEVRDDMLLPLQEQYGARLEITLVEIVTLEEVDQLYALAAAYDIPREQVGVPLLLIGEHILSGAEQIPAELPGLVEDYLAAGGVALPELPELAPLLPSQASGADPDPSRVVGAETAPDVVVQATLFTGPGCAECELVAGQVLKLSREGYDGQFSIETIDIVTSADVDYLYQVMAGYGFTKDAVELPMLIIGEQVLTGEEIPTRLPELIETYLQAGGVAPAALPTPASQEEPLPAGSSLGRIDGFWLAIGVMVFLGAALVYALVRIALAALNDISPRPIPGWQDWAIPVLVVVGLVVAGYLTYVETQLVTAICGPVGDCNAVQSSPYARLFGVLPVGLLGMLGYIAILVAWGGGRFLGNRLAGAAAPALYGMTFFGTLFSLYLTYLEAFVIRAVCLWCTSSAVFMGLLLLFSLNPMMNSIAEGE
jgi:uncharacterized membrane protein/thiol-disulfide isomerase/thioredoxin